MRRRGRGGRAALGCAEQIGVNGADLEHRAGWGARGRLGCTRAGGGCCGPCNGLFMEVQPVQACTNAWHGWERAAETHAVLAAFSIWHSTGQNAGSLVALGKWAVVGVRSPRSWECFGTRARGNALWEGAVLVPGYWPGDRARSSRKQSTRVQRDAGQAPAGCADGASKPSKCCPWLSSFPCLVSMQFIRMQ